MIALALAGLAVAAPPALASLHWNTQIKNASNTASRVAGGCSFEHGWRAGSLLVTCHDHHTATLVYVFATSRPAQGRAMLGVTGFGAARVIGATTVMSKSIRVTLTVSGDASVQLDTVRVSYYTS